MIMFGIVLSNPYFSGPPCLQMQSELIYYEGGSVVFLSSMAPTGCEEAGEPILMWIEVDQTLSGSANQQWLIPQQYMVPQRSNSSLSSLSANLHKLPINNFFFFFYRNIYKNTIFWNSKAVLNIRRGTFAKNKSKTEALTK